MADHKHDPVVNFETHPDRYKHLKLVVDGAVARIRIDIQEDGGLSDSYALKLNSYDLSVDIELCDIVQRLRFEHPEAKVVIIESAQPGIFCAGANIFMLGSSTHGFKVNFCRYTNETRLAIEDASVNSGQTYIAAVSGIASGGGYELALACEKIYLIDDRRSAVALPEVPYLGVLPGTGGLTRVVDKRKVRKDRADIFCTLAEGIKGKRAKDWNLVDDVFPSSRFTDEVTARAQQLAQANNKKDASGIKLEALLPEVTPTKVQYRHVTLGLNEEARAATLTVAGPKDASAPTDSSHYSLRMWRELEDALLRLRFNHPTVGLVLIKTVGSPDAVLAADKQLFLARETWLGREIILNMKRVLKRMDTTAKSFFALIDEGSCFAGSLFELALASDRTYMLEADAAHMALGDFNFGPLPMGNGLTRLATRFLATPEHVASLRDQRAQLGSEQADELGLVTVAVDKLDWDDELRLAIEERVSLSPDSLTGMEANLRFAGPETVETKIFGRLSAWQNWIFQRPNAVGEKGALKLYGSPTQPEFDWRRT